jgi:hypothetical protein
VVEVDMKFPYNITHEIAEEAWRKHQDRFKGVDLVITSDTAPLSRILLQNGFGGRLLIWVSNRFDYWAGDGRPDKEYYDLIRSIPKRPNVKIIGNTAFEGIYAKRFRGVDWGNDEILKPVCAIPPPTAKGGGIPRAFYIPPYHNETIFMDLSKHCNEMGLDTECGRYDQLGDLRGFRGVIQIPYAWSTLALFERWALGLPQLIPSRRFLLELSRQEKFWWQDSYAMSEIDLSEWYDPENAGAFVFFDGWNDLIRVTHNDELLSNHRQKVEKFNDRHTKRYMEEWRKVIEEWT